MLYPIDSNFLFLLLTELVVPIAFAPSASALGVVIASPIRSQLPLIARVGSPFSWTLSPSTFSVEDDQGHNTGDPLVYSATDLPPWLSFSASTLSFTGTVPTSTPPGTIPITVTASTTTSPPHSVSDSFDLLISASDPPKLEIPLSQQFYGGNPAISGAFLVNPSSALAPYYGAATPRTGSSNVGLRVPPAWGFSIGLQGGTFSPWPLHYSATLVGGAPLPPWITYDPVTFTFDGTAPGHGNGNGGGLPGPMEILLEASDVQGYSAGPAAQQSFWFTVASHELKMRDGNRGIERNVSVGSGFVLDLMDGPEENPWMGELFWDAQFLPRRGVQNVSLNVSEGTAFVYDPVLSTLSGGINYSNISQGLSDLRLAITDTQNITLDTKLVLNPVPSFFVMPNSTIPALNSSALDLRPGDIIVLQNFSSPVTFDLSKYMTPVGPSLIRSGAVLLDVTIKPETAKIWLSFDGTALSLKGTAPAEGPLGINVTTEAISFMGTATGGGSTVQERRGHRQALQSQMEPIFAASPTSLSPIPESTSFSSIAASTQLSAPLTQSTSFVNSTIVNITFSARSLESRTISTMHVILQLGSYPSCSPGSCSTVNSDDGGSSDGHAARVGLIVGLVLVSILLLMVAVACYRIRRNRTGLKRDEPQRDSMSEETMTSKVGWARPFVAYGRGRADVEKGMREKTAHSPNMAETGIAATAMLYSGSTTKGDSHVVLPPEAENKTTVELRNPGPHDDPGATSETSGSRYEDGTSISTRRGARVPGGGSTSGSGSDREAAATSGESDMEARRLAPPSKAFTLAAPYSRTISPAPSVTTAASGATLPKQRFFAKLKTMGQRPQDEISQSSSGEEELPPKVPSKTTLFANTAPLHKPSILANVMPTIKQSSLGSLLGRNNEGNGSMTSKDSGQHRGKGDSGKIEANKPRPLLPILGPYLAKDHTSDVEGAPASSMVTLRQPSDDGGVGFIAGNAVIYSMENRPLPITRLSTPAQDQTSPRALFPTFVWPDQVQPESGTKPAHNSYPAKQSSQKSVRTGVPAQTKSPSRSDVPVLLRNRSKEADIPQASTHVDSFSSDDASTLGGDEFAEEPGMGIAPLREVPRRRFDFGRPRGSTTDSDVPVGTASILPPNATAQHPRALSQESAASVAVVGTAARAVRSPMASATLVPSPKPSPPSTFDPGPAARQISLKDSSNHSPLNDFHSSPPAQARLVQFVHEKHYDGGSSSEGASSSDQPVPGAYATYQGKREISQKAVIESVGSSSSEKWAVLPPAPVVQALSTRHSSRLADKVKMLREQSRLYHDQQVNEGTVSQGETSRTPSPTEDGLLNDPALVLGIQYMKSFGSGGSLSSERENRSISRPLASSPEDYMGIAVGGEGDRSTGNLAGRARVISPGPAATSPRPPVSRLRSSSIAYHHDSQSSSHERRTPPRLPLPATPAAETQYFDLTESSSGSTSSSTGSDVFVHRRGQDRILVGVNEPFHFPAPLTLPGCSPGPSSRARILRAVKGAQSLQRRQEQPPESDSAKSSDSDGAETKTTRLWVELESGEKLPDWLTFDPLEAEFWGVPVSGARGTSLKVRVYFMEGNVTEVGRFIVEVVGR